MGILVAMRPWSFTASAVPVLVTAKLLGKLFTFDCARVLGMGILAQAAGNLINSYYDYVKKIDTKEAAGDESIVAGHISPGSCLPLTALCVGGATIIVSDALRTVPAFRAWFATGIGLALFYTAPPFSLKYRALGDLVILAAFGPVIMQACSTVLTGESDNSLNAYGVPIAILTEGILWANNARDIEADTGAGVRTVCASIGFKASRTVYTGMLFTSYAACCLLAAWRRKPGLLLPLLTLPIMHQVLSQFKEGKEEMKEAPDRTAQLHLPFGLMMVLGLSLDEYWFGY